MNSQEEGREQGEVGGCMWVPARRETAGLSQRERETEAQLSAGVCGYETGAHYKSVCGCCLA